MTAPVVEHLARTREELSPVLEALAARRIGLVVLDRDIDTAALPAPVAADDLLRRPRRFAAARPAAPAARTIDAHIGAMLDEGSTPEDAAAALRAEPVPAPEGGAWSARGIAAAATRRRTRSAATEDRSDA